MKGLKITSIIFIPLGIMLLALAYLFTIMHWPLAFIGFITGGSLLLFGTIMLVIYYLRKP